MRIFSKFQEAIGSDGWNRGDYDITILDLKVLTRDMRLTQPKSVTRTMTSDPEIWAGRRAIVRYVAEPFPNQSIMQAEYAASRTSFGAVDAVFRSSKGETPHYTVPNHRDAFSDV